MRLSAFNVYVPDATDPGCVLVYNTFSGGLAVLEAGLLDTLRAADAAGGLLDSHEALLPEEASDDSIGIVVESLEAEQRQFEAWYEAHRSQADNLSCIVSTTFACNLACTYCSQDEILDGRTMSPATAAATAGWLAARARETSARKVSLDFIGGEPLLAPERIEQIVCAVRRDLAGSGIEVDFGLITNGVLLDAALVERWLPLGLARAQITLDGDVSTHRLTRPSRRGTDTFAESFTNAVAASQRIAVTVVGNYLPHTVHGFRPLLARLREAGLPAGSRVRFRPALASLGAPTDAAAACTWGASSPEVTIALADETVRAGFDPGDPLLIGPCGLHQRSHFAIDPSGDIHECSGFLGRPSWAIGHVLRGLTSLHERLLSTAMMGPCGACAHRPGCGGGCIANAWLAAGRAEGVSCEMGWFEGQKVRLVQRKYALATCDDPIQALESFPTLDSLPAPAPTGERGSVHLPVVNTALATSAGA